MPYRPDAAWKRIGLGNPKKGDDSCGYARSLERYLVWHSWHGISGCEMDKRLGCADSSLYLERLPFSPARCIRNTRQHIPLAIYDCDRCADYKSFRCPHLTSCDRK